MRILARLAVACGVALLSATTLRASTGPTTSPAVTGRTDPPRLETAPLTVHVERVRLETPPPETPQPAALLKFEMLNDGAFSITDVVLEIVIREKPDDQRIGRNLVGPFTVGGHATIDAGFAVNYELMMRNLSADCQCLANVRVVSARQVGDPQK